MYREDAEEIEVLPGEKLDDVIDRLIECREYGENVYAVFNGHELYSCDITEDGAYTEIFGMTKDEWEQECAAWRNDFAERQAAEEAEAEEKIPEWIERGAVFIAPEQMDEWEECVTARASDIYHGTDLECALELMEMLENGDYIEDVVATFNEQGHSGASAGMVRAIINSFSSRGEEFCSATAW